ncbi:MAG: hypothetical protein AAF490_26870 [Chloroflexota bacterium]
MSDFVIEKVEYMGWPNCFRLSNGRIQLIVTTDIGPRIIHLSTHDGENIFKLYAELAGQTGGDSWLNYGGHRLWHAPEDPVRTYYPDNTAVRVEHQKGLIRFIKEIESTNGFQKEIDISLHPDKPEATVTHRLRNHNLWAVEAAPWALSVMREGGQGFLLHPPRQSHADCLVPLSALILWAYTDLGDGRYSLTPRTTRLQQVSGATTPQKIGIQTTEGWCGYHWQEYLFLKQITPNPEGHYPDLGSRMELFTDATMLEVETLGPLQIIQPGQTAEHVERWVLLNNQPKSLNDDALVSTLASLE